MGRFLRRILHYFHHDNLEEEMCLHRDLRAQKLRRAGVPFPETTARRQFGNDLRLREESRDLWGWRFLETTVQDIRYARRQFRKNTVFTAVAIATLALGIGANTAMFTIVDGVLLRPLPYHDPDRLVSLSEARQQEAIATFSYPNFQDLQHQSQSFESMAAWQALDQSASVTAPGEPEVIKTRHVSAGFVSTLGIRMTQGRDFLPDEDRKGAASVAILTDNYWQKRFSGATDIVGRTITMNGKPCTIIGVLPPDFRFFRDAAALVPLGQDNPDTLQKRDVHPGLFAIARLRTSVSLEQARSEISVIAQRIAQQFPKTNEGVGFAATPEKEREIGDTRPILLLLAGAVGLILLIACTNVANVLLARSVSRRHEFAIRTSLGAGRGRVIRQLLTESTILSLLGGLAGLLLAFLLADFARANLPADFVPPEGIVLDARVLLFAFVTSLITGFAFGLAPVLLQQSERAETIRQASRGTVRGLRRMQSALVATEIALTLVLLVGAGLMLRTLFHLTNVNPGFDPHQVYRVRMALSPTVARDPAAIRLAWQEILRDVQAVPGVEHASLGFLVPLGGDESDLPYWTTSEPPPSNTVITAFIYIQSPDYLRTLRIPLLRGRFFTEQDHMGTEPVVVIDEIMAQRAFPNQDALGKKISFLLLGSVRVVGIVGHVKQMSLDEEAFGGTMEESYFPFAQIPDPWLRDAGTGGLLVRTSISPLTVLPALRQSLLGTRHDRPIEEIRGMDEIIGGSMTLVLRRLLMTLLGGFAALALVLASVGIYGVISYSVNQRIQEMGIRMALGAQAVEVHWMIVRHGMWSAMIGAGTGVGVSLVVTRTIKSMLYEVKPSDPITLGAVALILTGVALAACWIPARRASRVDPVIALHYE